MIEKTNHFIKIIITIKSFHQIFNLNVQKYIIRLKLFLYIIGVFPL